MTYEEFCQRGIPCPAKYSIFRNITEGRVLGKPRIRRRPNRFTTMDKIEGQSFKLWKMFIIFPGGDDNITRFNLVFGGGARIVVEAWGIESQNEPVYRPIRGSDHEITLAAML